MIKCSVRLLSLAAGAMFAFSGAVYAQASPQTLLIEALKLDATTHERVGSPEPAVEAYAAAGLINVDADVRADYTSYFLVKKRTEFMGHTLVLIEHEYMDEYVGCCVSPGMGVTVRVKGDTRSLEEFATANGCSFSDNTDPAAELKSFNVKSLLFKAHYANLSCRERDVQQ
jgi:hypothetical protein